ncbi:MAG TPA: hypothetical protein VF470_01865, partial [Sphingomicrobium sp.]
KQDSFCASQWIFEWSSEPPAFGDATDYLRALLDESPQDALNCILDLIRCAPDLAALDVIGAGPLEDLIGWHGSVVIHQLEHIAATSTEFRRALRNVRIDTQEASIQERIRQAAESETLHA